MVLPTCPFPNLLWLGLYAQSDEVWLEGQENFVKQTWRNRFEIRGANQRQALTLHVKGSGGSKVNICEVRLDDGNWKREHEMSLSSAYGSAPFAIHYLDEVLDLLNQSATTLFAFNQQTIDWTLDHLGLPPVQGITKEFNLPDSKGLRANFKPGKWRLNLPGYDQMFLDKRPFEANLSGLDLLMNLGPEARLYLTKLKAVVQVSP